MYPEWDLLALIFCWEVQKFGTGVTLSPVLYRSASALPPDLALLFLGWPKPQDDGCEQNRMDYSTAETDQQLLWQAEPAELV